MAMFAWLAEHPTASHDAVAALSLDASEVKALISDLVAVEMIERAREQ